VVPWRDAGRNCLQLKAELAATSGSPADAVMLARQALAAVQSDPVRSSSDGFAVPLAHKLVGDMLWRTGDRAGAISAWQAGLAAWPKGIAETPLQLGARGEMLRGIGQRAPGGRIAAQLAAMGYRQSITNRAKM